MEFKDFKCAIDLMVSISKNDRSAYKLGIDLIDYREPHEKLISLLWDNILTEEGCEWLYWFLYDKDGISGNPNDLKALDGDKEICKNIEELHTYLKENSYFR